jgi:hypothetical protein
MAMAVSILAGNVLTGDYLLVKFNAGTQLYYVTEANPDRVTLKVLKLSHRGTPRAQWKPAKLSRFDARILGKSEPVLRDPILPNT